MDGDRHGELPFVEFADDEGTATWPIDARNERVVCVSTGMPIERYLCTASMPPFIRLWIVE